MAELFAFNVAVLERAPDTVGELGHYDPELQQFVWDDDNDIQAGSALCTRRPYGYVDCIQYGGTWCSIGGTTCSQTSGPCYTCDYG